LSFRRFFTKIDSCGWRLLNVGAWVQKGRIARIKGSDAVDGIRAGEEDGEWEMELVSAVAEALGSEEESEDAGEFGVPLLLTRDFFFFTAWEGDGGQVANVGTLVHRLTATLAFLIRLSPLYEDQLAPLLSVLQVGEALKGKLTDDGKLKVRKKEIRALVLEVADRLCSP
jgi:hypothetical protein